MSPHSLAHEVSKLFTLPDVAIRLNELISAPNSSSHDLARVVQLDPGLSAALLKLANSAYYGLVSRVDTIARAISIIGERELQVMAMAASVVSTFRGLPEDLVDMANFWDNSVTCGVIARILGRKCRILRTEQLFLAGLLHGVGKLVFYARATEKYRALLIEADARDDRSMAIAEQRAFGFDYATLGAELLSCWKLPDMLRVLVAYQLRPMDAPDYRRETALVHVAGDMAASLAPMVKTDAPVAAYKPGFDPVAWSLLGLDVEVIPEVMQEANMQALEILGIINPRAAMIY